jgi:hypothetical protein
MNNRAFLSQSISDNMLIITFNTSKSYQMPVSLLTSDIEQFERILNFSSKLIDLEKSLSDDYIKESVFADYMKTLETKTSLELMNKLSGLIQTISDKEIAFNEQIKKLRIDHERELSVISRDKKKLEDEATATKRDLEQGLDRELKSLRKQISDKDAELQILSKSENLIRDQCAMESNRLIKIIEEKNLQQIQSMRESIKLKEETLEQREARVLQRERELETTLQRNASSSFRGQDGESFFETIVETKMNWKLENTSKIPRSCDYSSIIHNSPVFFEVKNYTTDVRSDEVTKFLRDMKEHPEVHIGIFVSLNTRIAGKDQTKPVLIEWIHDTQCAVYIQSFKELDIDYTLVFIDQVIKMSRSYNKLIQSSSLSQESILQQRIDKARVYMERYITETMSLMRHVVNDQKRHRELVESSYSHTLSILKSQSEGINTALEILTDQYEENNTVDQTLVSEAPKKPKKKASGTKN